jgi:hypothetical protein
VGRRIKLQDLGWGTGDYIPGYNSSTPRAHLRVCAVRGREPEAELSLV